MTEVYRNSLILGNMEKSTKDKCSTQPWEGKYKLGVEKNITTEWESKCKVLRQQNSMWSTLAVGDTSEGVPCPPD